LDEAICPRVAARLTALERHYGFQLKTALDNDADKARVAARLTALEKRFPENAELRLQRLEQGFALKAGRPAPTRQLSEAREGYLVNHIGRQLMQAASIGRTLTVVEAVAAAREIVREIEKV